MMFLAHKGWATNRFGAVRLERQLFIFFSLNNRKARRNRGAVPHEYEGLKPLLACS